VDDSKTLLIGPPRRPSCGTAPDARHGRGARDNGTDFAPGATLAGRFQLDERIGEGGMGVVWAATHVITRQRVAIKLLKAHSDEHARRRFWREARAQGLLSHPNVVPVLDACVLEDGRPLIVMPLLDGETLRARLVRQRALPLGAVARIFLPVASAVARAHALGILHRDLKPENVLIAREQGLEVVRVLDFGIARLTAGHGKLGESLRITLKGTVLGTLRYMSPEQILGRDDLDERTDIWAIGLMMYEALTGRRAIEARGLDEIRVYLQQQRIPPIEQRVRGLPERVCHLLNHMLVRERDARLGDLQEVVDVLTPYAVADAPSSRDERRAASPCEVVPSSSAVRRTALALQQSL